MKLRRHRAGIRPNGAKGAMLVTKQTHRERYLHCIVAAHLRREGLDIGLARNAPQP